MSVKKITLGNKESVTKVQGGYRFTLAYMGEVPYSIIIHKYVKDVEGQFYYQEYDTLYSRQSLTYNPYVTIDKLYPVILSLIFGEEEL